MKQAQAAASRNPYGNKYRDAPHGRLWLFPRLPNPVEPRTQNWNPADSRGVILDMIMPEMGGRAAFARIRAIRPDARIIVASGCFREGDLQELERDGLDGFIQKPFRPEELSRLIKRVLAAKPVATWHGQL
jgi:CheY-like chemotaxis protein